MTILDPTTQALVTGQGFGSSGPAGGSAALFKSPDEAKDALAKIGADGLLGGLKNVFLNANPGAPGFNQDIIKQCMECIGEYAQGLGMDSLGIDLGGIMNNLFGGMDQKEIVAQMGTSGMGNALGQVGLGNLASGLQLNS